MVSKKIAILGLGTVGQGVFRVLRDHQAKITSQLHHALEVKKIFVRSPEKVTEEFSSQAEIVTDYQEIIADPDIDIVVEVMGGIDFAKQCIEGALQAGKAVVTANKDLICEHGAALSQLAETKELDLRFEAAVAGGIPILNTLRNSFAGDEVTEILGILNGTSNFIISEMTENGSSYQEALAKAQKLGFAEADPSADVDGLDAGRKAVILAKMGFGISLNLDDVMIKGISDLNAVDIEIAKNLGYVIKSLAVLDRQGENFACEVQSFLLEKSHPLAMVKQEMNAVYTKSKAGGEMMFYGPGAGELPTGVAVVNDIIQVAKNQENDDYQVFANYRLDEKVHLSAQANYPYYYRLAIQDQSQGLKTLLGLLNQEGISINHLGNYQEGVLYILTSPGSYSSHKAIAKQLESAQGVELLASYPIFNEEKED
ncbi:MULTISPECIES: homoserine dehydrogenase [Aerococcus]|uniref:homoserine dehydrogenase n=1 Tax=Aerococcus TaxID=1375 RepID=UPI0018A6F292|nr:MULTISPECIES: homoserine dehydrogenase [Aerococcus]MCY3036600.1 homoserine dehydrogenase [Aerococcus sp. Group 2]MCY3039561.1 homoserine dehydrogenase [Aerococcus sp. Group 2]MCY3041463.1 homoserine dehydrogenase [Aerococcus sp. Group 2]MCY3043015.1 homoserine dehydrogenase [Aerococcus sp. Group 2]MDK6520656.1 homoserine dehydrogenase [Aerococcus urinae]